LQEFISRNETSIAWTNKRAALDDLNKSDEAIKAYDKVIEVDPKNPDSWYNSAFFYSLINNKDQSNLNFIYV
jgi:tetratricopeptide (TPR) repeat protein